MHPVWITYFPPTQPVIQAHFFAFRCDVETEFGSSHTHKKENLVVAGQSGGKNVPVVL